MVSNFNIPSNFHIDNTGVHGKNDAYVGVNFESSNAQFKESFQRNPFQKK